MSISELTDYFLRYGAFFIYLIVLLEYLNLPGFPAGVIMPLAGIWAAKGEISFPMVMVLTVFAGLTGSWALYLLGRFGGGKVMEFYFKNGVFKRKRRNRGICKQASSDGAHADLYSGRNGKNEFYKIYG